jgi:parallel beta-helix repeat protein
MIPPMAPRPEQWFVLPSLAAYHPASGHQVDKCQPVDDRDAAPVEAAANASRPVRNSPGARSWWAGCRDAGILSMLIVLAVSLGPGILIASAQQGAVRMLYTVPNSTFIEQPSGETVVEVDDDSGSITALQAAIESARGENPDAVIVIRLLRGATYTVGGVGLVLGSRECLVAEGALIRAADAGVTVPLITIADGSTKVSIAGGTLDGGGANIQGIYASSASRVNIDKVIVTNVGLDGIVLSGNGNSTYDNEMTVTRSVVSGSPAAGIHIQDATQTTILDNDCHHNGVGIQLASAWASVANNTCHDNAVGIDIAGGDDNVVANNTCDHNGTGIHAGASSNMIVSNSMGNNTIAGIASDGSRNTFIDNLFTAGNATNFISAGTADNVIAYKAPIEAPDQNYFYPPLIDDQHQESTVVNGLGRTDLTIESTTIDDVQSQYDAAHAARPNDAIVLHLGGTFSVGSSPLLLSSNTCVLLDGIIQVDGSTTATAVIRANPGQTRISISGGVIDGGDRTGRTGVHVPSGSMIQVDAVTIRNFGSNASHHSGSDSIHFTGGATPYVVTRCTIDKSGARGIWAQTSGQKALYAGNTISLTRAGIDCDSHTFGAVMLFNETDNNTYGIWAEQGASHNTAIGNVSNDNDRYDLDIGNNSATPPTRYNSYICNTARGGIGIVTGAVGPDTFTTNNVLFNNVVVGASIRSSQAGFENYYAQQYQVGGSLTTSGAETFFNSADVSGNLQIRDGNSGLAVVVRNASIREGSPVVTGPPSPLGNGLGNDEWQFVPTDGGYYRIVNANSGLVMAVEGAALTRGAGVVQSVSSDGSSHHDEWLIQPAGNGLYNLVNRLSGLYLDVRHASSKGGARLIQWPSNGGANQQFALVEDVPPL